MENPATAADLRAAVDDLGLDPHQQTNLAEVAAHPDVVKRLQSKGFDGVEGRERLSLTGSDFDEIPVSVPTSRPARIKRLDLPENGLLAAGPPGIKDAYPRQLPAEPRCVRWICPRSRTGSEGAHRTACGHGLYFAGNEGVARGYRDNLSVKQITPEVKAAQDRLQQSILGCAPTGGSQAEFDAAISAARDAACKHICGPFRMNGRSDLRLPASDA